MAQTIKTGEILPRDYGITFRENGETFFISPMKYILGKIILESPQNLKKRIREKAHLEGLKIRNLEKELKEGFRKRSNTPKEFLETGRDAISEVKGYNNIFTAEIPSKSKSNSPYKVQLGLENGLKHARCECSDSFWVDVKRKSIICPHISALEIALFQDNSSKLSSQTNLTGLTPSQRPHNHNLPFNLEEFDSLVTQIMFDYFVEGKSQFQLDKYLLEFGDLVSDEIKDKLQNDKAVYSVLRQKERSFDRNSISETQKRYYGAQRALKTRIKDMLKEKGFRENGYGLEFKFSDFETVSERFRQGNIIYSVCTQDYASPFIIKKVLGEKTSIEDRMETNPLSLREYTSVDDTTRRESFNRIIIPGQNQGSEVFVPQILKNSYQI